MKTIELTQGKVAIVDDEDYEYLSKFKWYLWTGRYGYYAVRLERVLNKQKWIKMHRDLDGLRHASIIDHKDRNGLNNSRANLRVCSSGQNRANSIVSKGRKFKGVHEIKYKEKVYYSARIRTNKIEKYLGIFNSAREAALKYNEAAVIYHGEFARLNEVQ